MELTELENLSSEKVCCDVNDAGHQFLKRVIRSKDTMEQLDSWTIIGTEEHYVQAQCGTFPLCHEGGLSLMQVRFLQPRSEPKIDLEVNNDLFVSPQSE